MILLSIKFNTFYNTLFTLSVKLFTYFLILMVRDYRAEIRIIIPLTKPFAIIIVQNPRILDNMSIVVTVTIRVVYSL